MHCVWRLWPRARQGRVARLRVAVLGRLRLREPGARVGARQSQRQATPRRSAAAIPGRAMKTFATWTTEEYEAHERWINAELEKVRAFRRRLLAEEEARKRKLLTLIAGGRQ